MVAIGAYFLYQFDKGLGGFGACFLFYDGAVIY
jgi:hypothetical protein